MRKLILLILTLSAISLSAEPINVQARREATGRRTWTDTQGRSFQGYLRDYHFADHEKNSEFTVTIISKEGRVYKLSPDVLSEEDRTYLKQSNPLINLRKTHYTIHELFALISAKSSSSATPGSPQPIAKPSNPFPEFPENWKWSDSRTWTLNNSNTLVGRFQQLNDATVTIIIQDKPTEIPLIDLTRGDRIYAFHAQAQKGPYPTKATVAFNELTTQDRERMPSIDQNLYGFRRDGDCLPNSVVNTISWWHLMGTLPINLDKKAMTRLHKGDLSSIGYVNANCEFNLNDITQTYSILSRLAQNGNHVTLTLNSPGFSHAVTLVAFNRYKDTLTIRTWGEYLEASISYKGNGTIALIPTEESRTKTAINISKEKLILNSAFNFIIPDGTGKYF